MTKLSYEISIAITSVLPRCGECYSWMKSRDCPREHNVKGISRGPSCDDATCDKFMPKDAATAAAIAERWKPADEYLDSYRPRGLAKGGSMIEQRYEEIELDVRMLARSFPQSDFGSHLVIRAVAELVYKKSLEAYSDGYNTAVLDAHTLDAVTGAART